MSEELHCYSLKGPVRKTTFDCFNNHPNSPLPLPPPPHPLDVLMGNSKINKSGFFSYLGHKKILTFHGYFVTETLQLWIFQVGFLMEHQLSVYSYYQGTFLKQDARRHKSLFLGCCHFL